MQTTDEILLKAIENKDRKAFTQFYERYNRTVLCFVLSKVHNKDIAKDIVQNFWLAFWENPRILRANKTGCVKVYMLQHLRFRNALKNSSTLNQNAFWMRLENIPAKETANELNTTTQTVHNNFSKSLRTVREYIKKHYPEIVTMKLFVVIYFFK